MYAAVVIASVKYLVRDRKANCAVLNANAAGKTAHEGLLTQVDP